MSVLQAGLDDLDSRRSAVSLAGVLDADVEERTRAVQGAWVSALEWCLAPAERRVPVSSLIRSLVRGIGRPRRSEIAQALVRTLASLTRISQALTCIVANLLADSDSDSDGPEVPLW